MSLSKKPGWLRAKLPGGQGYAALRHLIEDQSLHTVCQGAQCPNLGECWARGTATVMILGNICTRSCNFCAIQSGRPHTPDPGEPDRVADAGARKGPRHAVITSVCPGGMAHGGGAIWANEVTRSPMRR